MTRRRELAVYDGRICLGRIAITDKGEVHAFDRRGKRLGVFPNLEAAAAAFPVSNPKTERRP